MLIGIALNQLIALACDCFGLYGHFNNVNSSYPWTCYVLPLIYIFFNFLLQGWKSPILTAPIGVLRILVFGPPYEQERKCGTTSHILFERHDSYFPRSTSISLEIWCFYLYYFTLHLWLACYYLLFEKMLQSILDTATSGVISFQTLTYHNLLKKPVDLEELYKGNIMLLSSYEFRTIQYHSRFDFQFWVYNE